MKPRKILAAFCAALCATFCAALCATLFSCSDVSDSGGTGIVLNLPGGSRAAKTDNIARYDIEISGAAGTQKKSAAPGETVEFGDLETGGYKVSAFAFGKDGNELGSGSAEATVEEGKTTEVLLKMQWGEFTVTFDLNGGSGEIAAKTVSACDPLGEVASPTKSGFSFKGWYADSVLYDADSVITKPVTLRARWLSNSPTSLIYDSYVWPESSYRHDGFAADKAADANKSTRWAIEKMLVDSSDDYKIDGELSAIYHTATPIVLGRYSFVPGEDTHNNLEFRNPRKWNVYGSDSLDGDYELIDARNEPNLSTAWEEIPFDVDSAKAYQYFKFEITNLRGEYTNNGNTYGFFQMSDFYVYAEE